MEEEEVQLIPNKWGYTPQGIAKIVGLGVCILSVLVILGWIIDSPALKSVFPGLATMKVNTALLFIGLGLGLLTLETHERVSLLSAFFVATIATLTIVEYLLNWNLGIDEMFIRDPAPSTATGAYPGRMSFITAINFVFLGGSLLSIHRRQLLSQIFSLLVLALAFLAMVGYIYDAESLGEIFPYSTIAVHTALSFIVVSLTVLIIHVDRGIMRIVFRDTVSGGVVRRLLPFAILMPLILGWLRLKAQSADIFNVEFGSALVALFNIVILLGVIAWMVRFIEWSDAQRILAETAMEQTLANLEIRVAERTNKLIEANEALQASQARFAGVINTAHDAIISVDETLNIQLYNQGAERIFGYSTEDIIGKPLNILLPDQFHGQHSTYVTEFGRTETTTRIMAPDRTEVRGKRQNAEEFPADISISSLLLDGKRIFTAVVRDTTERQEARAALAASEQRLKLLVNSVHDYAIYLLDPDGKIISWNEGATRIKGYSASEIIGQPYATFFTSEDVERGEPERILKIVENEGRFIGEGSRVRKDGARFWARVVIAAVKDEFGRLIGFSKVARDMTETKQAEEALKKSEALLRHILDILPVGVWITDEVGNINVGNMAGYEIWGGARYISIEEYGVYKGWRVDTGQPIKAEDWPAARAIAKGETSINEEVEIECFDGTRKYILNSAIPIRDDQEAITGVIIVNQDITSIKKTEFRLKQYADALERSNAELETFVYTASHDLQEPLWKIQAFGDRLLAMDNNALSEKAQDYLMRMINASTRMRVLIEDLLAYSRVTTGAKSFAPLDLNKVVASVVTDLELSIEQTGAQVHVEPLATIDGDQTQLLQLFQNLISNALKFRAPDRAPIIHITGCIVANSSDREVPTYEISVSDNGIGFEEKYASRIFGMFERLHGRTSYDGTGIGLAICQKVVQRHGGTIKAHGTNGEGASFVIKLPVQQRQQEGISS